MTSPSAGSAPIAPDPPLGMRLLEGFAWGVLCGLAAAAAGFVGHAVGGRLYPQRYEQIPSDFFFIPLGLFLGFVAGAAARLARPRWGFVQMFAVVAVAG